MRSIQTVTLGTSYGAGAIHLVAYRPLVLLPVTIANIPFDLGAVGSGMVRLFNDTVPWLVHVPMATTATTFQGQWVITQG